MLFALRYRPQPGRSEADSRTMRELLMAWEAPDGVELKHHFHYLAGGGVMIFETDSPGPLYEAMAPFKPYVSFEVEPVISVIEALAISLDVEEWVASVKGWSETDGQR